MRYSPPGASLFARNRNKLMDSLPGSSLVVVHAGDQLIRNGDQYYPYRQQSDFYYLTGIDQEESILLIYRYGSKDSRGVSRKDEVFDELLFLTRTDRKKEVWEGPRLSSEAAGALSGISDIYWRDRFEECLKQYLHQADTIYLNTSREPAGKDGILYSNDRFARHLKSAYPEVKTESLSEQLKSLRMIKEPEEIEMMKRAAAITRDALLHLLPMVRPGMMEYELEAEITREFIRQGAGGHAYAPIVASGRNACILHYIKNDSVVQDSGLILLDVGAEYGNYAADCSRTIPASGRFSKRQRELYEATLRVFRQATEMMLVGATMTQIQDQVYSLWEEEHLRLGLYASSDVNKQGNDRQLVKKYFPHGISHFLGLDVHDVGNKTTELKPGMVLTCEPGIYIEEEQTGIRLENNILITMDGPVDLMEDIPLEAGEIEDLMNR